MQRYEVVYADLTDPERPWRHDPRKLAALILSFSRPSGETITRIPQISG
jgi:hypothetical protein